MAHLHRRLLLPFGVVSLFLLFMAVLLSPRHAVQASTDSQASVALASSSMGVTPTITLTKAGEFDTPGTALQVQVSGTLAYVADRDGGLQIINVSNPFSPTLEGSTLVDEEVFEVQVTGTLAYVTSNEGLSLLNVSAPTTATLLGRYPSRLTGIHIIGRLIYGLDFASAPGTGTYSNTLDVVDFTDPTSPTLRSKSQNLFLGPVLDVQIKENIMYVVADYPNSAAFENELRLFDVSNPASPVQRGRTSSGTFYKYTAINVQGKVAYLSGGLTRYGCGFQGLPCFPMQTMDVSNSDNPQGAGVYNSTDNGTAIEVQGSTAYVGVGPFEPGVLAISVSDPYSPTLLARARSDGPVNDIWVANGLIYVASGYDGGLQIFRLDYPYNVALPLVRQANE